MNNHGHADTAGVDAWCVETGWEGHLGSDSDETRRGIDGSFLAARPEGGTSTIHVVRRFGPFFHVGNRRWYMPCRSVPLIGMGTPPNRPNKMEAYRRISSCYHRAFE